MTLKESNPIKGKSRKSQISAFILLALVIMTVFIFAFYIKNQITKQRMEAEVDYVAEVLQKTPVLNYYVTLCLKDSIEEALVIAGKQGGNIYLEQGGPIDMNSVPIFRFGDDNVTYGLTSIDTVTNGQNMLGQPSFPMPPGYPCIAAVPAISYKCPYDYLLPIKFYPFSQDYLPLLCMYKGPNDVTMDEYPFPCPSGSYGFDSIQEQIKIYAEKRMVNCVNFSAIKQVINFNITADPPQISPIMGEEDVVAKATYPINITVDGYGSVRMINFEVKIPVRLKKIYGLARFLVDNDRSYIDFNITKDFDSEVYTTPYWDPYMRVEKFCPKCSLTANPETTDILQINDSASNMKGSDYYFRFAVENRIPALEYIHRTPPDEFFDYIVEEGDEILIEPMGYDPDDDDDLYYNQYEGWKQTYDEVFDPSCCNEINPSSSIICKNDPWPCVKTAPPASLQLCMDDYLQEDRNVWTTSDLYLGLNAADPSNTYQNSNYLVKTTDPGKISSKPASAETNPVYYPCIKDAATGDWQGTPYSRDLGPHKVTAKVCDRHGKCDWQEINIMVTDIPRPVIQIANDYGTQEPSLEDPFTLDASRSSIFAVVNSYTWKDMIAGVAIPEFDFTAPYADTQNGRLRIPYPMQNYDIISIKDPDGIITPPQNFFKQKGPQTLSLTIGSQTATTDVTVKECIPFAGTYAPYPYNPQGTDPFMASHACCESSGAYSSAAKKCYDLGEYGSIKYFDDDSYLENDPTLTTYPVYWHLDSGVTQFKPSLTGEYGNDVFFRKFERYCSGNRGNICIGNAMENMQIKEKCADLEYGWQDERCQGPTPGIFSTASEAYCANYDGTTFESSEGIGGDGFCSDTPRCIDGVDYTKNGPFYAQKAICANGRCTKPYGSGPMAPGCSVSCGADPQCAGLTYNDLAAGKCVAGGFCNSLCKFETADQSKGACECTGKVWAPGGDAEINVNGNTKCCGNTIAEIYTQNPFDAADDACCDNKDASGNFFIGAKECVYNGKCKETKVQPEICNNIDDDCDGIVDNNIANAPKCGPMGVCALVMKKCIGGSWLSCGPGEIPGYEAGKEISCNDGRDNDCDGWKDNLDSDCPPAPPP